MNICKTGGLTRLFFLVLLIFLFCKIPILSYASNTGKVFFIDKNKKRKEVFLHCKPVDGDRDGTEEVYVLFRNFGDIYYEVYSDLYHLEDMKLVFNNYLRPGQYKIEYFCL